MAATSSISAVFNAVSGPFTKGTKAVVAGLNKVSKGAKSTGSALKTLRNIEIFRSIASSVRIAFNSLNRLRSSFEGVAQSIDKSAKVARTLGLSFEGYESLALVFRESGVEATLAEAMIAKLLRRVGEARKGGKFAVQAFQAIGISLDELKTIDEENIFKRTIGGLNELGDAFERQRVSQLLFEETGARLGSVIAKGAAGFEEAARTVSAFGLVLRRDQVKAVETLNDQINRTKLSIQGLYRQIVANLAPAITGVADAWNSWVQSIGVENIGKNLADQMWQAVLAAADWYDTLELGIKDVVAAVKEAANIVKKTGQAAAAPFSAGRVIGGEAALGLSNLGLVLAEAEYFLGIGTKEYRDRMRIEADIAKKYADSQLRYVQEALGIAEQAGATSESLTKTRDYLESQRKKFLQLSQQQPEEKPNVDEAAQAISTAISSKLASIDARSQEGVNFVLAQTTLRRQTVEQQQLAELKKILKATEANTSPGRQALLQYQIP